MPNLENSQNQTTEQPIFSVKFANTAEDAAAWRKLAIEKNIDNSHFKLWVQAFSCSLIAIVLTANLASYIGVQNYTKVPINLVLIFSISGILGTFLWYFYGRFLSLRQTKERAKKTPSFLEEVQMSFYEKNLRAKTQKVETINDYSYFSNFHETETHLFLMIGKVQSIILPKKFFTPEQIEFIKNKVKTK